MAGATQHVIPKSMHAVLTTGHGGPEKLEYRTDVPVPTPKTGEVLIQVCAAGINNTDINTRIGWYSKQNTGGTGSSNDLSSNNTNSEDATWSGRPMQFPRIQGADCCGRIVALGDGVDPSRKGQRVLVRTMLRSPVHCRPHECWVFGSECDGGFAQYVVAPAADVWGVKNDKWTDVELGSIPTAYSTAENCLHRAGVGPGDRVLITGASGGVGSATVQLSRVRGAEVVAVASSGKAGQIQGLGAVRVVERDADLVQALGKNSFTVVIDLVGGKQWPQLIELLRFGGRYAIAGAIAGPLVELDLRTLYLKDLTFFGCTWQDDVVFDNVVRYIEDGRLRPFVSHSYPLSEIRAAQEDFNSKRYAGKLVLVPPSTEESQQLPAI